MFLAFFILISLYMRKNAKAIMEKIESSEERIVDLNLN